MLQLGGIKSDISVCKSDEEAQSLEYSENQLINKIYTESAEVKIPTVLEFLGTMIEVCDISLCVNLTIVLLKRKCCITV